MRKPLIGLLLATAVAFPAAASAQEDESNRRAEHYERLEQRNQQRWEQRQQRQEQRQERIQQREQRIEQRQENWQQQQQQQQSQQGWQDRRGQWQGRDRQGGGWQQQPSSGGQSGEWVGDPNDPRMERHRRRYEQLERRNQREWQRDQHDRDWNRDGRDRGDRWGRNDRRWDRRWRHDRRYDWYGYRNNYRDLYRVGRYYDPYGYGYRRFSIGIRIGQPFYHQRYWINDPWRYRLPHAGPGYAWVRYYNDVLLIDTWSGEVVDVIYDFFW